MSERPHSPHGLGHHVAGLVICLILTAGPFAAVMYAGLARHEALVVIAFAGLAQLVVQMHYFLGIGLGSIREERGVALAFAAVLVLIMVGGTMWIMSDLGRRMMG